MYIDSSCSNIFFQVDISITPGTHASEDAGNMLVYFSYFTLSFISLRHTLFI